MPSPEDGTAIANGDGEIRAEPRSLEVRMAVSVMPCLFVPILAVRWKELIQNLGQVAFETRFKFYGPDHSRGSDVKDMGSASRDLGSRHDAGQLLRKILHVTVARRLYAYAFLVSHKRIYY